MTRSLLSTSAEDTRRIGAALGAAALWPLAFLLSGDYGTGKTTFVQGLARGLGVAGAVRSPSYNILKRYQGRCPLVHVDLYRTRGAAEIAELAIDEILAGAGVLAVEWPGAYDPGPLEIASVRIEFSFADQAAGDLHRLLVVAWREDCPMPIEEVLDAITAR